MYLSRLADCNLMTDIIHRISCHQPLPKHSRRYFSPAIRSNSASVLVPSPVHPSEESLWVSMAGNTLERSSSDYRAFHSPDPGTGQQHSKHLIDSYQSSCYRDVDLVQEGSVKSERPNRATRRFSHGNPGSLYPRHIMYPSGEQSQPECIDVTQFSTNSINHKSTHHNDTSGASKLHARNNLLRCIETNRGRFQHEQQGLIGQSLGHTHSEHQHDFQNLLHARTPLILGASPAELSVYPDSHQYARKQSKRLSTQPYIFSNGCKDISMSSEMALQETTKAMSSLLVTAEEQPSSEKDVKYGRGDIHQEQKDKEDTELTRLCRRRCISTSEAEPLSPILPPSSTVALRHQASRRLSCGGRLETYLETKQDRATVRDKGKGIYRSKRNSLTISTSFPVTDALCDTSMSSVSDTGSDRRASISSSISDISISLTHSTVSLSSSSSSTSIHDIPRKGGPPIHVRVFCILSQVRMIPSMVF